MQLTIKAGMLKSFITVALVGMLRANAAATTTAQLQSWWYEHSRTVVSRAA